MQTSKSTGESTSVKDKQRQVETRYGRKHSVSSWIVFNIRSINYEENCKRTLASSTTGEVTAGTNVILSSFLEKRPAATLELSFQHYTAAKL